MNLFSNKFDVTQSQLIDTLKSKHAMSDVECYDVFRDMANSIH